MLNRTVFLEGYLSLVGRAWSEESYFRFICENPRLALQENGIELPPNTKIEVVIIENARLGRVEDQIALWEEGERTGLYHLMIASPDFDEELGIENLENVHGGGTSLWTVIQSFNH